MIDLLEGITTYKFYHIASVRACIEMIDLLEGITTSNAPTERSLASLIEMIDLLEGITTSNAPTVLSFASLHWNDWPAWRDYDLRACLGVSKQALNYWNDWPAWRDYDVITKLLYSTPASYWNDWPAWRDYDKRGAPSSSYPLKFIEMIDLLEGITTTPQPRTQSTEPKLKWLTCLKGLRLDVPKQA